MKKKIFSIAGAALILLALGLVLAGCENDTTKGEYHLKWGAASVSYSDIQSEIPGAAIEESGSNWILSTGSMATNVYNGVMNGISNNWLASGDFDGSFEECLNFENDGIGAPAGFKNSPSAVEANVPLAGIFAAEGMTVLFYVTKN
jgi:hypothetical protein